MTPPDDVTGDQVEPQVDSQVDQTPPLRVCKLGRVDYRETWALQRELAEARKRGEINDTLLLLEHNPVITYGRNVGPQSLLWSEAELNARGVELVEVDRGGDATFHGPGQLVAYPIIDLRVDCRDVRRYIHNLEQTMIEVMREYGVRGGRVEGAPGAWVLAGDAHESKTHGSSDLDRKMGAVGVRLSRWVTHHGLGFNVNTDLDYFKLIVPCGLSDKGVTSLAQEVQRVRARRVRAQDVRAQGESGDLAAEVMDELMRSDQEADELILDFCEVERHLTHHFARLFKRRVVMITPDELISSSAVEPVT